MDAFSNRIEVPGHSQYQSSSNLSPSDVKSSPFEQFHIWFSEAVHDDRVPEPEAVCLSTAAPSGIPSSRFVLFKQLDARGFVFFTNYTSRKSQELLANPHAALAFYWQAQHRSVRIVGKAEKISREESERYFKSRPVESQLGAWASKQSTMVRDGEVRERLAKLQQRFKSGDSFDVPLPEFWGGWRIVPQEMEFWSGNVSRLHDRVHYTRIGSCDDEQSGWRIERLAP
jgi:pyridoxamine-phosphate oxidase